MYPEIQSTLEGETTVQTKNEGGASRKFLKEQLK